MRNWKAPAAIVITDPADPTTVTAETVNVSWVLSTPRPKDAVTVTSNGKAVPAVAAGHATVSLVEGENRIELVARDEKGGERVRGSVLVVREKKLSGAPAWAKVSEEQIAEAKRLGIPVAFENSIGMRFVLVPAGTFTMGSPEAEKGRFPEETQHDVTLTTPYYVAIHETTNGAYRRFKPEHASGEEQGTSLDGDTQPVVEVSHAEAVAFAAWLSVQDPGREYRLPTEAEWEHAARARTATSRFWGDDEEVFPQYANIVDLREGPTTDEPRRATDGFAVTAPVGSFRPNGWGLYDVIGNVCEMCSDWTGDYPKGPATDPRGPPSGTHRVARGGSWAAANNLAYTFSMVGPRVARSAFRSAVDPGEPSAYDGFRLVVSAR